MKNVQSAAGMSGLRRQALGLDIRGTTPEQLATHMRQEITRWSALAKSANIKID